MQIMGWLKANGMPSAAAGILSTIRSCKHRNQSQRDHSQGRICNVRHFTCWLKDTECTALVGFRCIGEL